MINSAPPLDTRRAADIQAQLQALLPVYVPDWREADPATGTAAGVSKALIDIFAFYVESIIERLNQVPEKNLLAFLDLLGNAPLAAQPARVPLTFHLAAGSVNDVLVPAGTQVAAAPPAGSSTPVVFETERSLAVVPASLAALFIRAPDTDQYTDLSALAEEDTAATREFSAQTLFIGATPLEHVLYLGHSTLFSHTGLEELRVEIELTATGKEPDPGRVVWEAWDGTVGIPLVVTADETRNLSQSGSVILSQCPPITEQVVNGVRSHWLRCRLLTPVSQASTATDGRVRASHLPELAAIRLQAKFAEKALRCDAMFANNRAVDGQQELLPFGSEPQFGDTFYLACKQAFKAAGTVVTLHIVLVNPTDAAKPPVPKVEASTDLQLTWECWDGQAWVKAVVDKDHTGLLTVSGDVLLTLPVTPQPLLVNGVENVWVRVRIVAGNYGTAGRIALVDPPGKSNVPLNEKLSVLIPPGYAPPLIARLSIDYVLNSPESVPDVLLAYNDFHYRQFAAAKAIVPFRASTDSDPTVYFCLRLTSAGVRFSQQPVSLYIQTAGLTFGTLPDNANPTTPPRLVWEYGNSSGWDALAVEDVTRNLTRPGLVLVLTPADFPERTEFGITAYWVRVRWVSGDYLFLPRIERVLINTVPASQQRTLLNEVIGSSDGSGRQRLQVTQAPVLSRQQLEVREPAGSQAVRVASADPMEVLGLEQGNAAWVPWQEVVDFHASGPEDRHYAIDRMAGLVYFGDGRNGRIPPRGAGNIRMARYCSGGGSAGNVPKGSVTQLLSSLPFIDRVSNPFVAEGGADAESSADFLARAPRGVRHQGQAVSLQDYEDLAHLATPEVARAKGIMLFDLTQDPDAKKERPGTVSLIVVPRSSASRPMPSLDLLDRVQTYLDARRSPLTTLLLVGPDYVRVDIEAEVVPTSLEQTSTLVPSILRRLQQFLHPLTGGVDGRGWRFGRKPHRSDVFAVLEAVPGVDHVRSLQVQEIAERLGAAETGRFLVYSGEHKVVITRPELPAT